MSIPARFSVRVALCLLSLLPVQTAWAAPDCEAQAAAAGKEAGIPDGILPAIARVESGHKGRAWPWTLNQGGNGSYHSTKAEALAKLTEILATGIQNVDLGCMQINWRWHAHEFSDAETMMDPVANTRYSARYLRALRDQLGDWDSAVAAYHSKVPARGAAYGRKIAAARDDILAELSGGPTPRPPNDAAEPPAEIAGPTVVRGLLASSGQSLFGRARAGDMRQARGTGLLLAGGGPIFRADLSADN